MAAAQLGDYLRFPQSFPEREVQSLAGNRPGWKSEWDTGRRLVRSGDLRRAVESYQRLLAAKANLEEARWELAKLLGGLQEWDKALGQLELLAETSPDNLEYLNALGLALRHTGQFGRALDLFGRVRERFPDNFTALVGLAQGLLDADRKKEALPLLQEIAVRNPDDRELGLFLATLAYEQGQLEVARRVLVSLAAAKKVEAETLLLAARIHDAVGREKEAAAYWERVLLFDQGHREARGWLARYLENQGRMEQALPHLQVLLEQDPGNISIIARICRIYLESPHRFTEGLPYYEKYVRLRPDDLDFVRSVIDLTDGREKEQAVFFRMLLAVSPGDLGPFDKLAAALAAAGKPEKAVALWESLVRVAPERVDIYRALSRTLEATGRVDRLIEVLEAIHGLAPNDREVIIHLARLKMADGDLLAGLGYYNKLEQAGYDGRDLYAGRAALFEEMGQPASALADYKKLLEIAPAESDVLRRCFFLAGELGDASFLAMTASRLENVFPAGESLQEMLLLAESLAKAREFGVALRCYRQVINALSQIDAPGSGPIERGSEAGQALLCQARLGLAKLYLRERLVFEAEHVLREGLLAGIAQESFLRLLFELYLLGDHPDLEGAKVWLDRYLQLVPDNVAEAAILQARLLTASGEYYRAEESLRQVQKAMGGVANQHQPKDEAQVLRKVGMQLAEVFLTAGDLAAAEQECLGITGAEADPEVLALLHTIYVRAGERDVAAKILGGLLQPQPDAIRLLNLAELFAQHGVAETQVRLADLVLNDWPYSLRAGFVKAEGLAAAGRKVEALEVGAVLSRNYPDSLTVTALIARLHYQLGHYSEAIRYCGLILTIDPARYDIQFLKVWSEMAMGNQVEATRLVQELYPQEGSRLLEKRLAATGLPVPRPPERKLWQILTFFRPPFDLVVEMLKPEAFFDQSQPERDKVNRLVSTMLIQLRWEKSFRAALTGG